MKPNATGLTCYSRTSPVSVSAEFIRSADCTDYKLAYHCNIALMQACNEIFLHNGASSPRALHYLSKTYAQLRQRLRDDEGLSDGTIGIVLSLVIQEQIRGQAHQAAVHWRGLQRMVRLRGGLDRLESNTELVLKICK